MYAAIEKLATCDEYHKSIVLPVANAGATAQTTID